MLEDNFVVFFVCARDYHSRPIFSHRSQCDVKTPSDSVFETAVQSKETPFNIPWLQLVRNAISLLLNHSHVFKAFRNGLLSHSQ